MRYFNPFTFTLLLAGVGMIAYVIIQNLPEQPEPIESLASFQGADAPLLLPEDGRPRHRLHRLSAWDLATIPQAGRFDSPMGSETGGLTYNAQKFWEMNGRRGGHHTGDDLNGIGGMNSDLGDPVFSSADGLVIYAGEPSSGWGKTLVVAHRTTDGRTLQSMYAHLHHISVPVGSLVARGQRIGLVGTANGHYPAHLHFEMRVGDGADIGAGYSMVPLNRLDPEKTVAELRGAPVDQAAPSLLTAALEKDTAWNKLELTPEQAAKLSEILDR